MTAPGSVPYPVSARQPVQFRRRRRPLPAVILIVVLTAVAGIVWIRTLESVEKTADAACEPPGATTAAADPANPLPAPPASPDQPPPDRGTLLARDALDAVEPLPPDAVKVRVLNANGQRGQAGLVAAELSDKLGFGTAGEPGNDPVYTAWDMTCHAQIRFGPNGEAAARTLSLVVPCAELIKDSRQDDTVDLALGQQFEQLRPSAAARDVLRRLTELAAQPTDPGGGEQGTSATVDPVLLAAAREANC